MLKTIQRGRLSRGSQLSELSVSIDARALAQHDCTWGTRLNWEHNMHVKQSPTTTKTYRTSPHLHRTRLAVAAMQVAEAKTVPGAGEAEMVDTAAEAAEMVVRAGKGKAAAMAAEAKMEVAGMAAMKAASSSCDGESRKSRGLSAHGIDARPQAVKRLSAILFESGSHLLHHGGGLGGAGIDGGGGLSRRGGGGLGDGGGGGRGGGGEGGGGGGGGEEGGGGGGGG
jgi:hypothetical protein